MQALARLMSTWERQKSIVMAGRVCTVVDSRGTTPRHQPVKTARTMKISIDSVKSLEIQNEYRLTHCRNAEYLGSFEHPQHRGNQDWTIHLYSVCDALVFATNGNPVWQYGNHEAFDALIAEYGIDLAAVLKAEGHA